MKKLAAILLPAVALSLAAPALAADFAVRGPALETQENVVVERDYDDGPYTTDYTYAAPAPGYAVPSPGYVDRRYDDAYAYQPNYVVVPRRHCWTDLTSAANGWPRRITRCDW